MKRYRWILLALVVVAVAAGSAVGTRMYGQHRLAHARSTFAATYGESVRTRTAHDAVDLQGRMMNARAAEAHGRAGNDEIADAVIDELLAQAADLRSRDRSGAFLVGLAVERIALELAEDRQRPVPPSTQSRTDGWRRTVVRDLAADLQETTDELRSLSGQVPVWERAWRWTTVDLEHARALERALGLGEALAEGRSSDDVMIVNLLDGMRRARELDALRERLSSGGSSESPARG